MKRDLFTSFLSDFAMITIVMTIAREASWQSIAFRIISNFFRTFSAFSAGPKHRSTFAGDDREHHPRHCDRRHIHYLTFFRRGPQAWPIATRRRPRRIQHCGLAMVQSSLICSRPRADGVLFQRFPFPRADFLDAAGVTDEPGGKSRAAAPALTGRWESSRFEAQVAPNIVYESFAPIRRTAQGAAA